MDMIEDDTPATGYVGSGIADRAARALIAYRAGFPTLMGEAVREITPLLWYAVRSQGVGRDRAEDVVQGVWVSFVGGIDTIREPQALLQWLLVAARRAAWASVRASRADAVKQAPVQDSDADRLQALVTVPEVDAQVLHDERDRVLWARFALLPERCQALLRLISLAERPDYQQISAALDMPVGSIGATRGRCLAKLRTLLADDDVRGFS
ncbi:RNA polymerase sigma factor, sigma-70 family [Sanguibacter gelidistatuariae]|uniref:RNA polymerase sigma factor, sigma-70 family n=1 Tax=Sanguibacter gelidistatuariae TaxID=1814289 RepID=A0A1G6K912_9MICO|nr:sigma-70 family RNA polymerase sigma factor [Sanguibacter gelidistatuariae]SDC27443.1 RNA polymerase sigma factor, sigma-70 family [Sanguibacter gelidistatuariae]